MAGGGSGLSPPRPALPPRSETWAAGQQLSAALPVNPPQPASPQLADDPDSPVSAGCAVPGKLVRVCKPHVI
jgi:hypothetical protein